MRKRLSILALAVTCIWSVTLHGESDGPARVVPRPRKMEVRSDSEFLIDADTCIVCNSPEAGEVGEMLQRYLQPASGLRLSVVEGKPLPDSINLTLDASLKELGAEGYVLLSGPEGVKIKARESEGLFYGAQTLRQLLPPEIYSEKRQPGVRWGVPSVRIEDSPRFEWRAFMLDEARHFKGMEVVKMLLDQMAALKMNIFHWHLTDDQGWRIEIKKYPKLTEIGSKRDATHIARGGPNPFGGPPHSGFYTQDQIREIVAYAAARQITIVPEIDMPGHASAAIAAYPELGTTGEQIEVAVKWGKHPNAINAADEEVYRMLEDILDEVAELFPGPVIHIGGDEVKHGQWEESAEIAELMEREGLDDMSEVQMYFTNRIAEYLAGKGRRVMGWNEIIGHDLGDVDNPAFRQLPRDAIIHFWKGSQRKALEAIERGHEVVNSAHSYTYLDYGQWKTSLRRAYKFDPLFKGLDEKYHDKVIGLGCQMWSEWVPTVDRLMEKVFPRLAAYAEVGWTAAGRRDYVSFVDRMHAQCQRWDIQGIDYKPATVYIFPTKSDFEDAEKIAEWTPEMVSSEWEVIEIPIPADVELEDYIEIGFWYSKNGGNPLYISRVELYQDGIKVSEDSHSGFSGSRLSDFVYGLQIPDFDPDSEYTLKARVRSGREARSHGEVRIRRPSED